MMHTITLHCDDAAYAAYGRRNADTLRSCAIAGRFMDLKQKGN